LNDYVRRTAAMKRIVEMCKKERECPHCGALNGIVKKVGSMRILHEKFKEKDKSERFASTRNDFKASFHAASQVLATDEPWLHHMATDEP
jgi:DNA-directed RNA polymerase III subunit RPC1